MRVMRERHHVGHDSTKRVGIEVSSGARQSSVRAHVEPQRGRTGSLGLLIPVRAETGKSSLQDGNHVARVYKTSVHDRRGTTDGHIH